MSNSYEIFVHALAQWLSSPVPVLFTIYCVAAVLTHALVGLRPVLPDDVCTRPQLVASGPLLHRAATVLSGASALAVLKLFLGR